MLASGKFGNEAVVWKNGAGLGRFDVFEIEMEGLSQETVRLKIKADSLIFLDSSLRAQTGRECLSNVRNTKKRPKDN